MANRLIAMVGLLPAIALILFVLLHALPGSPEQRILATDPGLSVQDVDRLRALRGWDRPVLERFGCWWLGRTETRCRYWPGRGLLRGDLGWSTVHGRPVVDLVGERLARTLSIMVPGYFSAFVLAWAVGLSAARHPGGPWDRWVFGVGMLGLAFPLHWGAMLLVLVFSLGLGWLPSSGIHAFGEDSFGSRAVHAVLPVATIALYFSGRWLRYVRAAAIEAGRAPFVTGLRARGVSEAAVRRHVARNALLPVLSVVGQGAPVLFSGALVVERVFVYPGMGALLLDSVLEDDYLVAIVVLLIFSTASLGFSLLTDVVLWALDPRMRRSGASIG